MTNPLNLLAVSNTDDCRFAEETGSISATVEWSMTTFNNYGEYDQILMAPVVEHLTDDNGDGVQDHRDIPDIVVIAMMVFIRTKDYFACHSRG